VTRDRESFLATEILLQVSLEPPVKLL